MALTHEQEVINYFGYIPIDGINIAAAVLFLLLGIVLAFINNKYKPCKFMIILVITAFCEVVGYAFRVVAAHNTNIGTFITTTLIVLLSPNAIALVNYIVAGRLVAISGYNVACLRPSWISRTFLASDVLSFFIQAVGGGMLVQSSTNSNAAKMGSNTILFGLAIQTATLFLFLFVIITIQREQKYGLQDQRDASLLFGSLWATTSLLFLRSIYRLVEYAMGRDTYIAQHEWMFFVFDTITILGCFILYCIPAIHFGRCLNALYANHNMAKPFISAEAGAQLASMPPVAEGSTWQKVAHQPCTVNATYLGSQPAHPSGKV